MKMYFEVQWKHVQFPTRPANCVLKPNAELTVLAVMQIPSKTPKLKKDRHVGKSFLFYFNRISHQ